MGELWELVDIDENKTGITIEREANTLIPQGMYHIAVIFGRKAKMEKFY